jgi:acetyltransferase
MQKIFNPKSITIIGASEKEGKIGNILMKNIQGENGVKIFPVNPKGGEIGGVKAYTSVLEINEDIDLAVIAVPAKFVNKVVEECSWREHQIKNIIIISAGFGEAGEDGLARKKELEKLIEEYDLNILGPNCLGIINATEGINLSFAKKEVIAGGIGLISQSGAFITSMIDTELGFSLIASLGNKIDINENELLDYYAQDENTKIIAIYLENISKGSEFQKKLKEITKIKPVVIIKAGTTNRTKQAIQSHTGSMAGEAAVIEEVIKDAGGILVNNLEDFVVILELLSNFKTSQNSHSLNFDHRHLSSEASAKLDAGGGDLVIVTNAGGPGVITTDLIENSDLRLLEFNEAQKKQLQDNLPGESSVNNPIDLLGDAQDDRYRDTFKVLRDIKGIGGVLALITPQSQTPIDKIIETVVEANKDSSFPVFPVVIGGAASKMAEEACQKYGINNFKFPVALIRGLSLINVKTPQNSRSSNFDPRHLSSEASAKLDAGGGNEMEEEDRILLSYEESEKISEEFGLNTLPADYPSNNVELRQSIDKLKLPIVMKVDSPNIVHKNERNGVVVGLNTVEDVEIEFERFQKDFPGEKILIQHQVEAGLEIILGLKRDDSFGLVLVIGLGGITTEILDEKILFIGEVTREEISRKLKVSKLARILKKEKIYLDSLVDQAERLFKLGEANLEIKEIDVNPMFFYDNQDPVIVDFKIIKVT